MSTLPLSECIFPGQVDVFHLLSMQRAFSLIFAIMEWEAAAKDIYYRGNKINIHEFASVGR